MLSAETKKMSKKQYLPWCNKFLFIAISLKHIYTTTRQNKNKYILRTLRIPLGHLIHVAEARLQRSQIRLLGESDFWPELEKLNQNLLEDDLEIEEGVWLYMIIVPHSVQVKAGEEKAWKVNQGTNVVLDFTS